jgi:hypothetical protein
LPPLEHPQVGQAPVPTLLLLGGVLAGLVLAGVTGPVVRWAAGRARLRAQRRLTEAVDRVAEEHVVTPVRGVLAAYAEAGEALAAAGRR